MQPRTIFSISAHESGPDASLLYYPVGMPSSATAPGSPGDHGLTIRLATIEDAEQLLAIYNREVLESVVTLDLVPRTLDEQRRYIGERSGALALLVGELTGETGGENVIVGFAGLSPFRDRPGYRTSVENSIYVHRDHHRKGIGSQLLAALVERARSHGFHAIFARISGSQAASLALHERHGFSLIGIEREVGRKFGKWLDVAVMQRLLLDGE